MQSYWTIIYNLASNPDTNVVYLATGCAQPRAWYEEAPEQSKRGVTDENNQQYPCFLPKLVKDGKKQLIVLFDPSMEVSPLRIENYFVSHGDPLELTNMVGITNTPLFRQYTNKTTNVIVINDYFFFDSHNMMTPDELNAVNESAMYLINLITICLGKVEKTKLIVQNFCGARISYNYSNFLDMFDPEDLINNVLFDVSGIDEPCFPKFNPEMCSLDVEGNFIQSRFKLLTQLKEPNDYKTQLVYRINILTGKIMFDYINVCNKNDYIIEYYKELKLFMQMYKVEFNSDIKDKEYIINKCYTLIGLIIHDVCVSKTCHPDEITYIISCVDSKDRSALVNCMGVLKYD
jgi:hypothetical protein